MHDIMQNFLMLQQLPLGFNSEQMTLLCLRANEKKNYIPKLVRVQQFSSVYFITTADDLAHLNYLSDLNANKLRLALNTFLQTWR
jgi:hypothetical protein